MQLAVSESVGKLTIVRTGAKDQHIEGGHVFDFDDSTADARAYLARLLKSGVVHVATAAHWSGLKAMLRRQGRAVPPHVLKMTPDAAPATAAPATAPKIGELAPDSDEADALLDATAAGAKAQADGLKHKNCPDYLDLAKEAELADDARAAAVKLASLLAKAWHDSFDAAKKAAKA